MNKITELIAQLRQNNSNIYEDIYDALSKYVDNIVEYNLVVNNVAPTYQEIINIFINQHYTKIQPIFVNILQDDTFSKEELHDFLKNNYQLQTLINDLIRALIPIYSHIDKPLTSLKELLEKNDKIGDSFTTNSQFHTDCIINRERPWIMLDNNLIIGSQSDEHGQMINDHKTESEQQFDDVQDSIESNNSIAEPFAFGIIKQHIAIINGTFGSPTPSIDSIKQQLNQKYKKVYVQMPSDIKITRLAKRLK